MDTKPLQPSLKPTPPSISNLLSECAALFAPRPQPGIPAHHKIDTKPLQPSLNPIPQSISKLCSKFSSLFAPRDILRVAHITTLT
jgi:hypothetical protein